MHVYIEGDGTPFLRPDTVAIDPTPRNPLMLHLMALDNTASAYVGRPCYFDVHGDAACTRIYWTDRRYGREVLDSMEAAIRTEAAQAGATSLELYGFSGGGTLAILLAQRMDTVARVVTIGANLDIAAWCALHHYTPLRGSINPADEVDGRSTLAVLHLVGGRDANSPPALVKAAAERRGGEPVRVVDHADHNCCWTSLWRSIVSRAVSDRPQ